MNALLGLSEPTAREGLIASVMAAAGEHRVLELMGEAGIGKTTVLDAVAERLGLGRGFRLTCFEAEAQLGLTLLSDLLTGLSDRVGSRALAGLSVLHRRVLDVALLRVSADALPLALDSRVLGSTLLALLELAATDGSVLVVIDDLQWADQDSFAALGYALRRLGASCVTVVAARRPGAGRSLPDAHVFEVPPLMAGDLPLLVRSRFGVDLPWHVAERVARVSGGNPFYALEIVRSLPASPGTDDLALPPTLRGLIKARVTGLAAATTAALLDVAVRGRVGRGYACVTDLDAAFAAGIVERDGAYIRFSHPLLAAGILDAAPVGALLAAHSRAARDSDDPVDRARHMAEGATGPDEQIAAALDDAAKVAGDRGDVTGAAWLSDKALTLTPTAASVPWHRRAAAVFWGMWAGDSQAIARVEALVAVAAPGRQRVEALELAGHAQADCVGGSLALCVERWDAALREPGVEANSLAEVRGMRAIALGNSGRSAESIAATAEAIAAVEPGSDAWATLAGHLTYAQRVHGILPDRSLLSSAAELQRTTPSQRPPWAWALTFFANVAAFDDEHDDARAALDEAMRLGEPFEDDAARSALAMLDVRVGRVREAADLAARIAARSTGAFLPVPLWSLAFASAWLGREAACRTAAARGARIAVDGGAMRWWPGNIAAVGFLDLTLGNTNAAWTQLEAACAELERQGTREPSFIPALPLAIEAAAATGHRTEAATLLDRLEQQSAALGSRWAAAAAVRSRAHIDTAEGDLDAAIARFASAGDSFGALRLPLERARALLARGTLLRRSGQRNAARAELTEALDAFKAADASLLATSTQAELDRLGGRRSTKPGALTPSELRVVELVSDGLSNSSIAQELHVTVKTVETHLTRAYHKYGVRSRVELANAHAHHPR